MRRLISHFKTSDSFIFFVFDRFYKKWIGWMATLAYSSQVQPMIRLGRDVLGWGYCPQSGSSCILFTLLKQNLLRKQNWCNDSLFRTEIIDFYLGFTYITPVYIIRKVISGICLRSLFSINKDKIVLVLTAIIFRTKIPSFFQLRE